MMDDYSTALPKPLGLSSDPRFSEGFQFLRKSFGTSPAQNGEEGYTFLTTDRLNNATSGNSAMAHTPNSMVSQGGMTESPPQSQAPPPPVATAAATTASSPASNADAKRNRKQLSPKSPGPTQQDRYKPRGLKAIIEDLNSNKSRAPAYMPSPPLYSNIVKKHTLSSQMLSTESIENKLKIMTSLVPEHFSITLPRFEFTDTPDEPAKAKALPKKELSPIPETSNDAVANTVSNASNRSRKRADVDDQQSRQNKTVKSVKLRVKDEPEKVQKSTPTSVSKTRKRQIQDVITENEAKYTDDSTRERKSTARSQLSRADDVVPTKPSPKRARQDRKRVPELISNGISSSNNSSRSSSRVPETSVSRRQESDSGPVPKEKVSNNESRRSPSRKSSSQRRRRSISPPRRSADAPEQGRSRSSEKLASGSALTRQRPSGKKSSLSKYPRDDSPTRRTGSRHEPLDEPLQSAKSNSNSSSAIQQPIKSEYPPEITEYCQNQAHKYISLGRDIKHKGDGLVATNTSVRIAHYIEAICCFFQAFWHRDCCRSPKGLISDWKSVIGVINYTYSECENSAEVQIGGLVAKLKSVANYQLQAIYLGLAANNPSFTSASGSKSRSGGDEHRNNTDPTLSPSACAMEALRHANETRDWLEIGENKLSLGDLRQYFQHTWRRCTIGNGNGGVGIGGVSRISYVGMPNIPNLPKKYEPRDIPEYIDHKSGIDNSRGFDPLPNVPLLYPSSPMSNVLDIVAFTRFITREWIDRRGLTNSFKFLD